MFENLLSSIDKKRIVLLGESAHGIREQNLARTSLIKILVEDHGFQFLFIESMVDTNGLVLGNEAAPLDFIKSLLHPVYHTNEILDLFKFVKKSQISLEGFEICGQDLEMYRDVKINVGDKESRTYRDKIMFSNFSKIYQERLNGKKVIIWGHNAHLMKKTSPAAYRDKVLGEFIHEAFPGEAFSIGQYTGKGLIEHMPGQRVSLRQEMNSVEEFIVKNIQNLQVFSNLNDEIFSRKILTMSSGIDPEEIILSEHFEALILHHHGSAPVRF